MKLRVFAVAALSTSVLVGCQSTGGNKQDIGQIAGAVIGGVIGSQVGDSDGSRVAGIAVGALLGGLLGSEIGRYLDEQDRQRLSTATQEAIYSNKDSSWKNPDSGVAANVRVKDVSTTTRQSQVRVLKDSIDHVPPLDLDGGIYRVRKTANMRGGPSTDYKVVDSLPAGSEVDVIGKVQGKNWYMLSESGVGKGFVYANLLAPTGRLSATTNAATQQMGVETVQVSTQVTCKEVEQQVTTPQGDTKTHTVKACQNPDGGWVIS